MTVTDSTNRSIDDDVSIHCDRVTIARSGREVIRDLTWSIRERETWAMIGPSGSGKTTLAEALAGRTRIDQGSVRWPFIERLRQPGRQVHWPSEVIHRVSFKEESRLFSYSRHYYQQRFNFIEPQDDLTLSDFLRSGTSASDDAIHGAAGRLGVEALLPLSLIKLSNGQIRRARIARALLAKPEMLILDDPFMGLDTAGRCEVSAILGELVAQRMRLLLITRPEAIPDWVTQVLEFDRSGPHWQGRREECSMSGRSISAGKGQSPPVSFPDGDATAPILIEMHGVNVAYDGRPILHNINWTVRAGERWALLGPNGSGKSTLLSLICGDHPQAYSNDITLFGRQRGTGETIWDIKKRIGLVSPELHLYFSEPLTVLQTIVTGFHDVLTRRPTTAEQDAVVRDYLEHFEIIALAERPFASLSTGEQRLVLLLRSLVKQPDVLIMDEPFQGLDGRTIERLREWFDRYLKPEQTLIIVSHLVEEIPQSVDRQLVLHAGRIKQMQ